MNLQQITRRTSRKTARQVGRGGKRGKTAGRGTKGQNARSGAKLRPAIRDAIKKLPKLRGYAFNSHRAKAVAINLSLLENKFSNGETVNPQSLVEKKVVEMVMGKIPMIKILATGELTKKITIQGIKVSESVKSKLEKVGGSVVV
jgi:large subunit ribosomal protein L15